MGRTHLYLTFILLSACGLSSDDPNAGIENPYALVIYEFSSSLPNIHTVLEDSQTYTTVADSPEYEFLYRDQASDNRLFYMRGVGGGHSYDILSVYPDGTGRTVLAATAYPEYIVGLSPSERVIYLEDATVIEEVPPGQLPPPRIDQFNLYSVLPDGTGRVPLAVTDNNEKFLMITDTDKVIFHEMVNGQANIRVVNADGLSPVVLAGSTDNEEFVSYIPMGKVVYRRFTLNDLANIYSVNVDGTGTQQLTSSANSKGVLFVSEDGWVIYSEFINDIPELKTVKVDNSARADVPTYGQFGSNYLSYTGNRVIYNHAVDSDVNLSSINPDGTDGQSLTTGPDYKRWMASTESGRVIYGRWVPTADNPQGTQLDLFAVSADGTDTKVLADGPNYELYLDRTKDGNIIYGESDYYFSWSRLHVVPESGSAPAIPITPETGRTFYFGTANDGRIVYMHSDTPGDSTSYRLYAVNQDGTGNIELSDHPGQYFYVFITPNSRVVFQEYVTLNPTLVQSYSISSKGENRIQIKTFSNQDGIANFVIRP